MLQTNSPETCVTNTLNINPLISNLVCDGRVSRGYLENLSWDPKIIL